MNVPGSKVTVDQLVHVPWYKSKLLHGLLVIAVTHTLVHYKLIDKFTEEDIASWVDEFLSWLGYIATATVGGIVIRNPFVTLTQKKADIANATSTLLITDPKNEIGKG